MNRAKDNLVNLKAAFEPIADKAVPERIFLRTKIDDHENAIQSVERDIADWK